MSLRKEKILAVLRAHTHDELVEKLSEAMTTLPSTLMVLASEDTTRRFIYDNKDLQNPQRTFERIRMEKQLMGYPFGFEKDAGDNFVVTDLESCVLVRYEPA